MKDIQFQQLNKQFEFIARKISAHDEGFDKIDKQFEQVNGQLEFIARTVAGHENKFGKIDKIFEKINARFDNIDSLLMNHDQRLFLIEDNMVTKREFRELINTIDYSVKTVMNMKEDHVFGTEWMKRMQEQLGWHEQDIRKLKLMLNLA